MVFLFIRCSSIIFFFFQMRFIPLLFVLISLFVILNLSTANPIADPKPGHMVIQYYKDSHARAQKAKNEKLRYRCESQINSGYVTDRKCQEWFEWSRSDADLRSTIPKMSLLLISSIILKMLFWWPKKFTKKDAKFCEFQAMCTFFKIYTTSPKFLYLKFKMW